MDGTIFSVCTFLFHFAFSTKMNMDYLIRIMSCVLRYDIYVIQISTEYFNSLTLKIDFDYIST